MLLGSADFVMMCLSSCVSDLDNCRQHVPCGPHTKWLKCWDCGMVHQCGMPGDGLPLSYVLTLDCNCC